MDGADHGVREQAGVGLGQSEGRGVSQGHLAQPGRLRRRHDDLAVDRRQLGDGQLAPVCRGDVRAIAATVISRR